MISALISITAGLIFVASCIYVTRTIVTNTAK